MKNISAIVAVDNQWAIGSKGNLLFRLKDDMKYFKEKTIGNVVVMGRKTFESFPKGALPDRINIVITRDESFTAEGVIVAHSIEQAMEIAHTYDKEIFCIGGEQIYRQMLKYCNVAYVTMIMAKGEDVDAFFPNLLHDDGWGVFNISALQVDEKTGIKFRFYTYKRR